MIHNTKAFTYIAGIVSISGLGAGTVSYALRSSVLDFNFFNTPASSSQDLDPHKYSNVLGKEKSIVKSHLMNNSHSLMWKKSGSDQSDTPEFGNAFFIAAAQSKDNVGSINLSDKWSTIDLLFGTSLTFVKSIFDNVSDFKSEVNESNTSPTLSTKSSKNGSHKLHLSQNVVKNQSNTQTLGSVYSLTGTLSSEEKWNLNESLFLELKNENVELVYAATDLSVNAKLKNLHTQTTVKADLLDAWQEIKEQQTSEISWVDSIGEKYFAADFAVIKIKLFVENLGPQFLNYLRGLNNRTTPHMKFNGGNYNIVDNQLSNLSVGGWRAVDAKSNAYAKGQSLVSELIIKSGKENEIKEKKPSEITDTNFSEYFELKFFPKIHQAKTELTTNYEIYNKELIAQDANGVLLVKYQIKDKSQSIVFPEVYSRIFSSLKVDSSKGAGMLLSPIVEVETVQDFAQEKKYKFLSYSPTAHVSWHEMFYENIYFDYDNLTQTFKKNQGKTGELNNSEPFKTFTNNNKNYVNIGHSLSVLGTAFSGYKGALATISDEEKNTSEILGIYEGIEVHKNGLFEDKTMGKVLLLISPTRYDLISKENNFSKPSLYDALSKKSIESRLMR